MFKEIYKYELINWFKRPSVYFYFLIFFGITLLSLLGTVGYFDGPIASTNKEVRFANSPFEINYIIQYFTKFFLFLLPAIIGATIYKDFKYRVHSITYSYPIKKRDYLFAKFLSSLTIVIIITLGVFIAYILGEFIAGQAYPKIGPFSLEGHLSAFAYFVLPNMLIYGLLVFITVGLTRNIYAGFVTVILIFLLQIITENIFAGNHFMLALSDPLGQHAVGYLTHLWTISEQNINPIPIAGPVLWNRLFWLAIASCFFYAFYRKFSFSQEGSNLNPLKSYKAVKASATKIGIDKSDFLTKASINYGIMQKLKSIWSISNFEFNFIVKNGLFLILLGMGILALIFSIGKFTNTGDMILLPMTNIVLSIPMFFYSTIIILVTFIFSGMLVHRSRTNRVDQLVDSTATADWVMLLSKLTAIVKVQLVLLAVMMIAGIVIQLYNQHYDLEIGLYIYHLLIITFPIMLIWAVLSIFIHTIIPNLYIGLFTLVLVWIGKDNFNQVGIDTKLIAFNAQPMMRYSDLDGFGYQLQGYQLINYYWLSFSGFLLVLTSLLWQRGMLLSIKHRMQQAIGRITNINLLAAILCLALFLFLGFTVYQEENKISFDTSRMKISMDEFQRDYNKYSIHLQPKITSVYVELDLDPYTNSYTAHGNYTLINKSKSPIDTLLIKTGFDESTDIELDRAYSLVDAHEDMKFSVYKLAAPLASMDSMTLKFNIASKSNSAFERNSTILNNGTLLRTDILPRLGYSLDSESLLPSDSLCHRANYYSPDADLVKFEAIISTSQDQIGITSGDLVRRWQENDKNYAHYKIDELVKFGFSFNSGKYESFNETYQGIDLKLFHHKAHNYNNSKILDGIKAALDYNTKYLGPYQHSSVRVVEFPLSEGTYATMMANSMQIAEQRFVVNSDGGEDKVDLSFYVPAHEFTHQWFGNQLVPANAKGAKMLTESLTEYFSLRIYENYYGTTKALNFLKKQRERYLKGRAKENEQENPLYLVRSNQEYISYGKGAMVFNALKHHLGEEVLNDIIKQFLLNYKFRTDYYPSTIDFLDHLKTRSPIELQSLISDMFEHISIYDNSIVDVESTNRNGQEYLDITYKVSKETDGNKTMPLNELIEIVFFNANGEPIHTEKINVQSEVNKLSVEYNKEFDKIILDPNLLLLDKNLEDNEYDL